MSFFNKYPYTDFHELNLDWLIDQLKTLMIKIESLENWKEEFEEEYNQIKEFYNALISGDLPPAMQEAIFEWCSNNLTDLVGKIIKNVYFGLSNSGYFVAYIPESWEGVEFETIQEGELYGHLILQYD